MIRRVTVMTVVLVLGSAVAACGLPTEGEFQSIDRSEDGFGLWETSTTTSTTTTIAPTTTVDLSTTSTIGETTTTVLQTEPVTMFFPTGQQLTPIPIQMAPNPALPQVMAAMVEGPLPEQAAGIRLILPKDIEPPTVTKSRGVVTVDFPEGLFDDVITEPADQRLVFGQIVLTLSAQRGVGQVIFTLAGEPMRVFKGNAVLTEQGEAVTEEDYTVLLGSPPPVTTTTTVSSTNVTNPPDPGTTVAP